EGIAIGAAVSHDRIELDCLWRYGSAERGEPDAIDLPVASRHREAEGERTAGIAGCPVRKGEELNVARDGADLGEASDTTVRAAGIAHGYIDVPEETSKRGHDSERRLRAPVHFDVYVSRRSPHVREQLIEEERIEEGVARRDHDA